VADKSKGGGGTGGTIFGLTLAGAAAAFAGYAYSQRGKSKPGVKIEDYAHMGESRSAVFMWDDLRQEDVQIATEAAVVFDSFPAKMKFLRDVMDAQLHIPLGGALLAAAHASGIGNWDLPVEGFNFWGVPADDEWVRGDPKSGTSPRAYTMIDGDRLCEYETAEEAVLDWFYRVLEAYPQAREELGAKVPDPYAYAEGLTPEASKTGQLYSIEVIWAGGPLLLGRYLAENMVAAALALKEFYGFDVRQEVLDTPVWNYTDIFDIMCERGTDDAEMLQYVQDRGAEGVNIDARRCERLK